MENTKLYVLHLNNTFGCYSVPTCGQIYRFEASDGATLFAVHPSGRYIFYVNTKNEILALSTKNGVSIVMTRITESSIETIAVSPDGRYLAAGLLDGKIKLWLVPKIDSSEKAKHWMTDSIHYGSVTALSFTPSGVLVSGGVDSLIYLSYPENLHEYRCCEGHNGWISKLHPIDDNFLLSISSGQELGYPALKLWDSNIGAELYSVEYDIADSAICCTASNDGELLVAAKDRYIFLYNLRNKSVSSLIGADVKPIVMYVSNDNKMLHVVSTTGIYRVYDLNDYGENVSVFRAGSMINSAKFITTQ